MSVSQLGFEQLFELERGLRSSIRIDQQKAFDFFPEHLKQYADYPDVLEASMLRLLDFFKARSMERRMDIIRALEIHIDNDILVFNGDEIIRRLAALWEINDSLLRSLVLRWFGLLRKAVGQSPDVYYRIGESLISPIREEYMAAIGALEACLGAVDEPSKILEILGDKVQWKAEGAPPEASYKRRLNDLFVKYAVKG